MLDGNLLGRPLGEKLGRTLGTALGEVEGNALGVKLGKAEGDVDGLLVIAVSTLDTDAVAFPHCF